MHLKNVVAAADAPKICVVAAADAPKLNIPSNRTSLVL